MKTYTIKEISERYQVQASTLRYYEEIGLLINVGRTANGQRIYTDEHIARMDGITCFKNTGLPIAQILEFYRYESDIPANIDDIIALVEKHEEDTARQIEKMQRDLLHIRHKIRFYHGIKKAIENKTQWPDWNEV